jgi:UPF0755 protein
MRILRLLALLVLVAGIFGIYLLYRFLSPYQRFQGAVFVDVPRGTTTEGIAERLAAAGVVRSKGDFLLARLWRRSSRLQAGEYRFDHAASAGEVFDRIARGDIFFYSLAVPEGRNMFDIGAEIEKLGLFPASEFVAAAKNPAMIRDLDPDAPSLEGYLFPNSYRLNRHATPESVCRLMTGKFREVWYGIKSTTGVHQTITLASLVEKEGKLPEERPRIAAVFENRLRIGMKLDCDPTTIYAALLEHRYRGTIYRSDLDSENAYNTYRHAGLPPGPIANPGAASIQAVLQPAPIDAIYFVLKPDGSGSHEFNNNMAAHDAATGRYRRGLQKVH